MVRVLAREPHTPAQFFWEYLPPTLRVGRGGNLGKAYEEVKAVKLTTK